MRYGYGKRGKERPFYWLVSLIRFLVPYLHMYLAHALGGDPPPTLRPVGTCTTVYSTRSRILANVLHEAQRGHTREIALLFLAVPSCSHSVPTEEQNDAATAQPPAQGDGK